MGSHRRVVWKFGVSGQGRDGPGFQPLLVWRMGGVRGVAPVWYRAGPLALLLREQKTAGGPGSEPRGSDTGFWTGTFRHSNAMGPKPGRAAAASVNLHPRRHSNNNQGQRSTEGRQQPGPKARSMPAWGIAPGYTSPRPGESPEGATHSQRRRLRANRHLIRCRFPDQKPPNPVDSGIIPRDQ